MNASSLSEIIIILIGAVEVVIGIYLINIFRMPSDIIKLLSRDVDMTIKKQNQVIADLMIKVDVLLKKEGGSSLPININKRPTQPAAEINFPIDLGSPNTQILELLKKEPLNSAQVQSIIRKSREHTARELKRMTEMGLVERDVSKRPYTYKITNKGRNSIT